MPIEVYHQDDEWHVRRQGTAEVLSNHPTKEAAVSAGRAAAEHEGTEFVINDLKGRADPSGPNPPHPLR
ncbi:DUF2188 domain-containing protein [Oerskovia turbata]|uniref:DUF2188 domain-containing protein n=1 Tax=Oerskovia turbata TaxID=1713 RepID=UPI000A8069C9|nr:DUF2188 domain-containing protein [Oerskovia turbata]